MIDIEQYDGSLKISYFNEAGEIAIDKIDIQLLDMWGDVIPWSTNYPTEWSATLTLTE